MSPNNGTQLCVFVQARLVLTKYSEITAHFEAWSGIWRRGWWYLQYLGWPADLNCNDVPLKARQAHFSKKIRMTQILTYFRVILSAIVRKPSSGDDWHLRIVQQSKQKSHQPGWWIYLQCKIRKDRNLRKPKINLIYSRGRLPQVLSGADEIVHIFNCTKNPLTFALNKLKRETNGISNPSQRSWHCNSFVFGLGKIKISILNVFSASTRRSAFDRRLLQNLMPQ